MHGSTPEIGYRRFYIRDTIEKKKTGIFFILRIITWII